MVIKDDLEQMITAAVFGAIGATLALLLAALFWPPPEVLSAAAHHPYMLPSQHEQVRVEPREKAFLALAASLGFLGALAGVSVRRLRVHISKRCLLIVGLVVPVLNLCADPALNQPSGATWALVGLVAELLLAWAALRSSRQVFPN